jgi:nucleolar GTP-binding protein
VGGGGGWGLQAALFHSIKPLFANKPLLVVCNKTDVTPLSDVSAADRELLREMHEAANTDASTSAANEATLESMPCMSTLTEAAVAEVKALACEKLLTSRVEQKLKGKHSSEVMNRIHVAMPTPRDGAKRPAAIPANLEEMRGRRDAGEKRVLERDLEEKFGGAGVYSADFRKNYDLEDDAWKYDIMPEILDGHNVLDFVDPDIEAKLDALEREEEELMRAAEAAGAAEMEEEGLEEGLDDDEKELLDEIKTRKARIKQKHQRAKSAADNASVVPRKFDHEHRSTTKEMKKHMDSMGIDASKAIQRARSVSRGRKRTRDADPAEGDREMAEGDDRGRSVQRASRSRSRVREASSVGLRDEAMAKVALKKADQGQRQRNKKARKGEGDRHIPDLKPKHLFSGKRGIGKTDRR